MKVILDTNVLYAWNEGSNKGEEFVKEHSIKEVVITTVTYIEFLGAAQLVDKVRARKFLRSFTVKHFSARTQAAAEYLCMRHVMRRKEAADFLISCVAKENGFTIVTDNLKDFALAEDVQIIQFNK